MWSSGVVWGVGVGVMGYLVHNSVPDLASTPDELADIACRHGAEGGDRACVVNEADSVVGSAAWERCLCGLHGMDRGDVVDGDRWAAGGSGVAGLCCCHR